MTTLKHVFRNATTSEQSFRKCASFPRNDRLLHLFRLVILFLLTKQAFSEFRFCYKGPHKIRETACPGGFVAFFPLNATCMFYAKGPDVSEVKATFAQDMCDGDNPEIELDPRGETDFSGTRMKILFEYEDEFAEPTPGIEIHEETCASECLKDWVNPLEPEDEPMLNDKPPITDYERKQLKAENAHRAQQIFKALIYDKDLFQDVLTDDPIFYVANLLQNSTNTVPGFQNIIKLLAKSMRVTIQQCSPFVQTPFYEQVLRGMIHLHATNKIHSMVEIDPLGFHTIYKHLDACEKAVNTRFLINGTHCDKMQMVDTIVNLDYENGERFQYRRQSLSFRWGVYDPLVEAAWVAVDFVHGFCFETFYAAEDVLHFHLYMQAMEALFPVEPVQKHWIVPVKLRSEGFWNTMLDTVDAKNQMRNLDACAIATYLKKAPYPKRLLRPFVHPEQIEYPEYVTDDAILGKTGWEKSVGQYWAWYEKQGSFKELSKSFGYCLDGSREDLEAVEKDMQENELNCNSQIT